MRLKLLGRVKRLRVRPAPGEGSVCCDAGLAEGSSGLGISGRGSGRFTGAGGGRAEGRRNPPRWGVGGDMEDAEVSEVMDGGELGM